MEGGSNASFHLRYRRVVRVEIVCAKLQNIRTPQLPALG
jgi:hypothetical protein